MGELGVDLASNTVLVSVPAGRGRPSWPRPGRSGPRSGSSAPRRSRPRPLRRPGHLPRRVALLGRVQHPQRQRPQLRAHRRPLHRPGRHLDDLQRPDDRPGGRVQLPRQRLRGHPDQQPGVLDPRGGVLHYGAFRDITGAGRVLVGSSACKTGSTTGTTCGTVQAYNVTVNYAEGTVFGMTRTNICTQPGDSGGAKVRRQLWPRGSSPAAPSWLQPERLPQLLPASADETTTWG